MKRSGLTIVGLDHAPREVEEIKRLLSELEGVREVEFNDLTRKLKIAHDGSERCVREIRKVLGSRGAGNRPEKV